MPVAIQECTVASYSLGISDDLSCPIDGYADAAASSQRAQVRHVAGAIDERVRCGRVDARGSRYLSGIIYALGHGCRTA